MKALILGATGLVGSLLYEKVMNDESFSLVKTISRAPVEGSPKTVNIQANLDELENFQEEFNVDVVLCALGTTIKKAGSKVAFEKVDYDFPLKAAKLLKAKNPQGSFVVITAMGSDATSSVFYNKTKGRLEDDLLEIGLRSLTILRPSLILGNRDESRPLESIGQSIAKSFGFLLNPLLPNYAGIEASQIALRMLEAAKENREGCQTILSGDI